MTLNDFPRLRPGQLLVIDWFDATTNEGWALNNIYDEKEALMRTVGFFKYCTTNGIILCATYCFYDKGDNDRFFIPLGTIVSIKTYPVPRKPKLEK